MRLLLFNLATDADDPVLGFTTRWINALARHCRTVEVLTMRAGRLEVAPNVRVRSVGKEKGYSEPRRAIEFYRLLAPLLRRRRVDACFSHMMPLFTVMAGPLLRARRIPTVTWYAHPTVTRVLKAAHFLSDRMVTSLPSAYPWKRDKLEVIGQGIDTELFAPDGTPADDPPMILCAGRLSPVKDHPTLLRALKLCRERGGPRFQAVILGGPATAADEAYARSLHVMTRDLGLAGCVRFEPARPLSELPPWYRRSTLNVNMTRTGSGDKTVLEAMSCERLCVFANEGFREVAGPHAGLLFFRGGSETELCERIESCLSLPAGKHVETRQSLRQFVIENHGLARLAGRVVSILRSLETSASG